MFLELLKVVPIVFVLASCSYSDYKYQWFEGRWISDTDSTLQANRENGASEEYIQAFAPSYGKLEWLVVGRTLTVSHPDGFKHSTTFELNRISDSILEFDGAELRISESRFCVHPRGETPLGPDGEIQMRIECFRRIGT